jgi:hypothetical protein
MAFVLSPFIGGICLAQATATAEQPGVTAADCAGSAKVLDNGKLSHCSLLHGITFRGIQLGAGSAIALRPNDSVDQA